MSRLPISELFLSVTNLKPKVVFQAKTQAESVAIELAPCCRPSWLSLSGLPPPSSMACAHCSAPMVFLLQLYAPYHWPGLEAAFHRTVFVFMCRRAECHAEDMAAPFAVFRSQLGRSVQGDPGGKAHTLDLGPAWLLDRP